ncbi:MAG: radical SAM protein [Candidatus Margulisbacteria bacterium]|jgi:spore photoproduct lyase|nr:radical SAM protein [Candidatus Margulisiibacteriota bacterium]
MAAVRPEIIYIEKEIAGLPYTQAVLQKFSGAHVEIIEDIRALIRQNKKTTFSKQNQPLVLAKQRGRFLEKCPGTKEHICCNYYTLNIAVGCPYDCTYCFLQSYSNNPYYTIYVNLDEMLAEIRGQVRGKIRLGTGEFTDSLALETYTQFVYTYSPQICALSPDITLELKTKSNWTLSGAEASGLAQFRKQLVFAWSVNPQNLIDSDERGATPLRERIRAARTAAECGYCVALHFDPIIYSADWAEQYQTVLDLIRQNIPPEKIAWLSLGTLRFTPTLKPIIEQKFPASTIVYGELFPGRDKKMRYPEPLRVKIYQHMLRQIAAISPCLPVYLCMESPEVWKKVYNQLPAQVENLNELF